ncbi:cyclic nucleotide-binding domain-containing protein [Magnetococcus sp. PR-3]|uniref:cyclic nucleotide-binding domain-containing protein n=1 Tax=Magnetococcus sp. PR-3 TaxID=3120355 RepID=UPI002FCE4E91
MLATMRRLLGIQQAEVSAFRAAYLLAFIDGLGNLFLVVPAMTLFLSHYPADELPIAYMSGALISVILSLLLLKLQKLLSTKQQIITLFLIRFVTLLLLTVTLIWWPETWLAMVVRVWALTEGLLRSLSFWQTIRPIFTPRQSKRLLPTILAGQSLAAVIAGLSVGHLVASIDISGVYIIVLLLNIISVFLTLSALKHHHPAVPTQQAETHSSNTLSWSLLRRGSTTPHLRHLLFLNIGLTVIYLLLDNAYNSASVARYSDPSELSGFLGMVASSIELLMLFVQFALAGPLMRRYGLSLGVLAPASMTALVTFVFFILNLPSFQQLPNMDTLLFALVILSFAGQSICYKFARPTLVTLYLPLGSQAPSWQTLNDGVLLPLVTTLVAGGLLLLREWTTVDATLLLQIVLPVSLITLAAGWALLRQYRVTIEGLIHRGGLASYSPVNWTPAMETCLVQELSSPHAQHVIYCMDLLKAHDADETLQAALPKLLEHKDATVRRHALQALDVTHYEQWYQPIIKLIKHDPDSHVRQDAATLLMSHEQCDEQHRVTSMTNPDQAVCEGSMAGALRSGDVTAIVAAGTRLQTWLVSEDKEWRKATCRVLILYRQRGLHQTLKQLLDDEEPEVILLAMDAVLASGDPRGWQQLVSMLGGPYTQQILRLLRMGNEAAIDAMIEGFGHHTHHPALGLRLLRALEAHPNSRALPFLLDQVTHGPTWAQIGSLHTLVKWGYTPPTEVAQQLQKELSTQLDYARTMLAAEVAFNQSSDPGKEDLSSLIQAAKDAVAGATQRILYLLSLLHGPQAERVRRSFEQGTMAEKAFAAEWLDSTLAAPLKNHIAYLLDTQASPLERLRGMGGSVADLSATVQQWLQPETNGLDSWFSCVALHYMVSTDPTLASAFCQHQQKHPDPLITQHVAWAQSILAGDQPSSPLTLVQQLRKFSLLASFGDAWLARLLPLLQEHHYKPEEIVVSAQSMNQSLYLILDGQIEVSLHGQQVAVVGAHDYVGELGSLTAGHYPVVLRSVQESHCYELDFSTLCELMAWNRTLIAQLTEATFNRVLDYADVVGVKS